MKTQEEIRLECVSIAKDLAKGNPKFESADNFIKLCDSIYKWVLNKKIDE